MLMLGRFEAVVRRSLVLALAGGAAVGPAGCYLFRPWPMHIEMYAEKVQLSAEASQELQALHGPGGQLQKERCAALCTTALKTHSTKRFDGCSWEDSARTIECVHGDSVQALSLDAPLRYGEPIPEGICHRLCGDLGQAQCRWPSPRSLVCHFHTAHPAPSGRRPKGLLDTGPPKEHTAAAWFARCASLEAAAVVAFAELHEELCLLGAPEVLRAACQRALAEERRHVRLMTELARAGGAEPEPPPLRRVPPRTLLQLALDNAQEGCVRESFGAISALWQSLAASDAVVRHVMAQIARDETRHAELALALEAWLQQALDGPARREVTRARRSAYVALRRELESTAEPTEADRTLGLPQGRVAQELLDGAMGALEADCRSNKQGLWISGEI